MNLKQHEYNPFYAKYISLVGDLEIVQGLTDQRKITLDLLASISDKHFLHFYAENKWTIKEVLQHIIDNERIFCTRALRIARSDTTSLPGYDQDTFAPYFGANDRSKSELINDYIACRNNSISLFNSFSDDMLLRIGTVSDSHLSTRAAGCIIMGHEIHHINVLKRFYLIN